MADIDNKIYEVDNRKNSYFIHLDDLAYLFYKGDLVLKTLYSNLKIKFNEKYKDEPLDVLIPNEGLVINTAHYSKDELKDLLYNVLKEKYSHFWSHLLTEWDEETMCYKYKDWTLLVLDIIKLIKKEKK